MSENRTSSGVSFTLSNNKHRASLFCGSSVFNVIFFSVLKHENKALQIENMFGRFSNSKTIDLNKISAKQYFEKVIAMTNAKTEDGYRKIILE